VRDENKRQGRRRRRGAHEAYTEKAIKTRGQAKRKRGRRQRRNKRSYTLYDHVGLSPSETSCATPALNWIVSGCTCLHYTTCCWLLLASTFGVLVSMNQLIKTLCPCAPGAPTGTTITRFVVTVAASVVTAVATALICVATVVTAE
jgi:hypothetical protein